MKKILLFSANPKTTPYLRLDEEVREIQAGLERARQRAEFELIPKWAVRPRDLRRALLDHEPQIVHFSGHGKGAQGLCLENDAGEVQLVSAAALAGLFKLFSGKIECVLFNACYSEAQAEVLQHYTDYVIGMNGAAGDTAALKFATGFYDALGAGRGYADAYEFGRAAIDLEGLDKALIPVLKKRSKGAPPLAESEAEAAETEEASADTRLAEELLETFKNLLDSAGVTAQVKARDEFSYYDSTAMQRIRAAMEHLKQLPAGKPEHNHLNILAGSTLSSAGRLEEAEKLFVQARECAACDYEYALASFNLFQVRLRRKAHTEALADLQAAIQRDPRRYALHDTEKYPIERILGAGGMGCAFLCRHSLQERSVVVKCLWETRRGPAKEVFREAFLMRKAAGGKYVPEPLDYGYADPVKRQRAFFVSEYIEGAVDGDAWLEQHGKLALEPGLRLALQIAAGLRAAHKAGICHYDLKPANLLFLASSASDHSPLSQKEAFSKAGTEEPRIKIIDFGLAGRSLTEGVRKQRGDLSLLGQAVFGTLDYAPPEQQGMTEFGPPGPKSDIFSFGATLYRLFSGDSPRFPHPRSLPDSRELQELLLDCLMQQPQRRPDIEETITRLERALAALQAEQQAKKQQEARKKAEGRTRAEKEAREKARAEHLKREQEAARQKAETERQARDDKRNRDTSATIIPANPGIQKAVQSSKSSRVTSEARTDKIGWLRAMSRVLMPGGLLAAGVYAALLFWHTPSAPENPAEQARQRDDAHYARAKQTGTEAAYLEYAEKCRKPCAHKMEAKQAARQKAAVRKDNEHYILVQRSDAEAAYLEYAKECRKPCAHKMEAEQAAQQKAALRQDHEHYAGARQADTEAAYRQYAENCQAPCAHKAEAEQQAAARGGFVLTVKTEPADARVRILNIVERYRDGIRLSPGRYHIEVSKDGYLTHKKWRELNEDTVYPVALKEKGLFKTWRKTIAGVEFKFSFIKGGSFSIGCHERAGSCYDDEKPAKTVRVGDFYLGQTEVTQGQWKAVMGDNPSYFKKGDNYPVESVSWLDAQKFIDKLNELSDNRYGFRLPAEAEWEYAARNGGEKITYPWGDEAPVCNKKAANGANFWDCSKGKDSNSKAYGTQTVGTYAPNKLGLYDMAGNVWEWTCSEYSEKYQGQETKCSSKNHASGRRVLRGGSWNIGPAWARSASRNNYTPGRRYNYLGFRPARIE
ncbi:MAG: SUMF1/EgtB/PvdO family nonheme iron enzyme [Gammaproteobacteria bacterium]|nr:SUMF1/EgtB/PvdO family nonheme iron enzyme [Gammaproteobacteria bacterium]